MRIADDPIAIADFELTAEDGRAFRFSSLRGRSALVFFGFTHCPDVCPATMSRLKVLEASHRRQGIDVPRIVMISVDGDRDTPEAMSAYLEPLSADFIGLTGDPKRVRAIAEGFSAVFFKGLPADKSGAYTVEHTSQVYLVDADGKLRATFFEASPDQMSTVVRAVAGGAGQGGTRP